jgi:hypothetical protein
MHLSLQFPELFRRETYAVNLQLNEERQVKNVFESDILAERPVEGVWDKDYSVVPIGELNGRAEGEDIPQKNMTMGYTCYGATAIEATGKVGISKLLKQRSREFTNSTGDVDEPKFAGYIADTASRGFLIRAAQKKRILSARIFNYGGIQAGNAFFNQRTRCGFSDVPDSNLIYDGSPLFAAPAAVHHSYAANATSGTGSAATGNFTDWNVSVVDTGGYFNAFMLPPSYWALKRVWTHFCFNMQFDENDQREDDTPNTLLVSAYNYPHWTEVLKSKFVEPRTGTTTTNTENIFMMEGFQVKLVPSVDLVRNTWYLGKAKSQGIVTMKLTKEEDPWAYWRDEKDRSYWISFEQEWGFMVRNWRRWVAGAISTDGTTAPNFGNESTWDTQPAAI